GVYRPCRPRLLLCNKSRLHLWNTSLYGVPKLTPFQFEVAMTPLVLNRLFHSHPLRALTARVGAFFDGLDEARSRVDAYRSLARLSDTELARRGLTRDGIVQAVFSDAEHA